MRARFTFPFCLMAVLAAGCADQTTTPEETGGRSLTAEAVLSAVALSAEGRGWVVLPKKGQTAAPGTERFTFNARKLDNGEVSGSLEYHQHSDETGRDQDVFQNGSPFCMNDQGGGLVVLAARGTHRVAPNPPMPFPGLPPAVLPDNDGIVYAVLDDPAGGGDQITAYLHTTIAVAGAICANPAAFGFTPAVVKAGFLNTLVSGRIRVR